MKKRFIRVLNWFRSLPKKVWIPLLIAILIVGFFGFKSTKSEPLKYEQVRRGSIKSTISATGVLTGKDKATLKFISSGRLSFSRYKVGELISKGVSVAGLDTQDLSLALQQAEAELRSKQASAEKALDDVKGHSADETYAQKESRTKAEVARDQAVSELNRARAALRQSVISSPIAGVLTESNYYPGQFVTASDTIAKIVDWSSVYFDAEIDEADISKISLGQKVTISLNSYPDNTFDGTVAQIIPQTQTTSSGGTVVKVRIDLGNPQITLVDGLNGDATITISEHENSILVTREALREDNKILVSKDGRVEEREVKLGIESDEEIEIVSGVKENESIVTNPSVYKPPKRFLFF